MTIFLQSAQFILIPQDSPLLTKAVESESEGFST